jgi:hypothetical protein
MVAFDQLQEVLMRKLITGTIAVLGLVTVLAGSASASDDNWLRQGGPGVVVNQGVNTANVDPNGQYANQQTSDSALHRDAQADALSRNDSTAAAPDRVQHAQDQNGQTIGRIGG